MRGGGTVNADGFGVGWLTADGEPVRYRRAVPMWTDANFGALARTVTSGAVLANVRSATIGMPIIDTACAPFTWDRWFFSHNGRITGWPDSVAPLAATLPVTDLLTMDAPTDAALLAALVRHRLAAGAAPGDAITSVVTEVAALAPGSRLNLLLTDGDTIHATTFDHALSVLAPTPDAVVVASEPWDDDPRWQSIPDQRLVVATRSGIDVRPLTDDLAKPETAP